MKTNAASSTTALVNHWVAKFIFGTRANGGYSDVTSPVTSSTNIAKVKANIMQQFQLDGLLFVSNNDYTKGFIGYVKETATGANSSVNFHNLSTRRGNRLTLNGVNYILLNDAGLNVKGWGNVNFDCAFVNRIEGVAALVPPFYDSCTYTLQFSRDGGSNWQTCSAKFLNGVDAVAAHTNPGPEFFHSFGESSSSGTLTWRFTSISPEGTSNNTGTKTLKPTAYMCQAQYWRRTSVSDPIPTSLGVYSGGSGGSGVSLFMYKSDFAAIMDACFRCRMGDYDNKFTGRGDVKTVGSENISTFKVAASWKKLYNNTGLSNPGYYLLNKEYGIYVNSSGNATHFFWAYLNETGNTPYIRLGIYVSRRTVDNEGVQSYALSLSFTAVYENATDSLPDFDTNLSFRIRWSTNGTTAAQAGVWFNDGTTYKTVNLSVTRGGTLPDFAGFSGYTEGTDLDIQSVVIDNMTRKRADTGTDAMIDGNLIGVSQQYTRDIE